MSHPHPASLSQPVSIFPHRLRPGRRNSLKSPGRMSCCCHLRHVLYWWLCVEFQALWAILCVCCKSVLHVFYSSEKHCYLYLYAVGASEICVSCSSGHVEKVNITQLISASEHGIWYFCPWNMLVLVSDRWRGGNQQLLGALNTGNTALSWLLWLFYCCQTETSF